jgi:prepilin signal peptidase PulO-like enzyme (type II secretory pathway)
MASLSIFVRSGDVVIWPTGEGAVAFALLAFVLGLLGQLVRLGAFALLAFEGIVRGAGDFVSPCVKGG